MKIIPLTPEQAQILADLKATQENLRLRENELLRFSLGFHGVSIKDVASINLSPDGRALLVEKKPVEANGQTKEQV